MASCSSLSPISNLSTTSSSDQLFCCAMNCRVAVKYASGKHRPPNHRPDWPKSFDSERRFNCSTRLTKSIIQAVAVMLATTYLRHCLGICSACKSSLYCFRTFVYLRKPLHRSKTAFKSAFTESRRLLTVTTSRSKNLKSGFWIDFSFRSKRSSYPGSLSSICSTLGWSLVSQVPASSLPPASLDSISSPVPWISLMFMINLLAWRWRTIFSTLLGRPDQDGVSVTLMSLIHFW